MKRTIYILLLVCILLFAFALFVKPTILFIAKRQLNNVFVNSIVEIGACTLNPLKQLSLLDIEIKKDPLYDFKAGQIGFNFTPFSILKGRILKATLHDVAININLRQGSILELNKQLNSGSAKSLLAIDYLELTNLLLDLKSKELNIKARLSSGIDLVKQEIDQCDLGVDALDCFGLALENASLNAAQLPSSGRLNIAKVKYDKAVINQIKADSRLEGSNLNLDSLSAQLFNGDVLGDLSLKLDKEGAYRADLEFIDLDMDTFVKDFKLEEKFNLSGKLSGVVKIAGRGLDIEIIEGNFKVNASGGTLTISDTGYLEKMARNSGESLDISVESLKDYHYNSGRLKLYLEKSDLILDIALEGEAGKRNLDVILHNFRLKKEGA